MRVLSLFDGCSGARQALKNLNTEVEYFASEIDKYAIKISKKNHPDVIHLGDVRSIDSSRLPKIDLLIAGFPCQDLSRNNKKRKGLKGQRSGLFFDAMRIMDKINPEFFLFENVNTVDSRSIDKYLGIFPTLINSCTHSPQLRSRLYWTNFHVSRKNDENRKAIKDILIDRDFTIPYQGRRSSPGIVRWVGDTDHKSLQNRRVYDINYKSPCINASYSHFIGINGKCRRLHPEELEQLQGLPKKYTAGVSKTQRIKMIGNGFTVPVIEHLIRCMKGKIYRQQRLFI